MTAALPATKLNEVVDFLGVPAFKNSNPFSAIGKKKTELKHSMNALLAKNPTEAYTGLGIIYNYENQLDLACNAFQNAYRVSNKGYSASRHLANQELLFGDRNFGISLFLNLVNEHPLDFNLAFEFTNKASSLLFMDELNEGLKNHRLYDDIMKSCSSEIQESLEMFNFIKRNKINIEIFRDIVSTGDKVFSRYFTVPTETGIHKLIDNERHTLTISYELPDFNDLPEDLLGEMNDNLQDEIIYLYKKYKINSSSPEDKITMYFEPADIHEVV
ncbi:tetratricopeptide repeat protein [Acinetobacter junii]|uniref:tetratricopeptide repeat protein n=1 Tax=Acinetobacter junii TaxID=40215 RepID=UPI003A86C50C